MTVKRGLLHKRILDVAQTAFRWMLLADDGHILPIRMQT